MEQAEAANRGSVLLATVKGDVHDIGKNLVEIVLSNNGYQVVNLGIRVPSEQLVQAAREHQPDLIGLSGLLVKSAQQMVLTAGDLASAGISVPLLVGGAALTRRFTHRRIAAAYGGLCTYGRDAMHGLALVERIVDPEKRPQIEAEVAEAIRQDLHASERVAEGTGTGPRGSAGPAKGVRRDLVAPPPPDLDRHVETLDLETIWELLNTQMLYGKHLGLRGSTRRLREKGDPTVARLDDVVDRVKRMALRGGMSAQAVWRFYPARAEGDLLEVVDPDSRRPIASWLLPRQQGGGGFCLADYVLENDHVALLVTTAGVGIREQVEELKREGEYLLSHALAALAVETAEAAAEHLHERLRREWGFPDGGETTVADKLAARYRGKRYSFGYPACPDLVNQVALFEALRPETIGVRLTEGYMMDPEASVSAVVFHHPDARYFAA
jgi:5-methyltetrahydrofolate--homocysteine methyltransferase